MRTSSIRGRVANTKEFVVAIDVFRAPGDDVGLDLDNPTERVQEVRGMPKMSEYISLLACCYLKQGEWQSGLKDDWNPVRFYNTVCYPYCLTRSNEGQHS